MPPPTPNRPLKRPASVPITASFSERPRRSRARAGAPADRPDTMRGILDRVTPAAMLVEALEPLRSDPASSAILMDIDGTLAPIVRHAADAHVPQATRTLLIEIARRYRIVGLRQRAARHRRPPDGGDRDDRLCRQPRRRTAAPRRHPRRGRPAAGGVDGPRARVRRARVRARAPAPARAQRGQGLDRRLPLAREPPTRSRAEAAVREIAERAAARGPGRALGPQGARGAPARCCSTRGVGITALLGDGPVGAAAVRGRRHHRPRRLPRPARAGLLGSAGARDLRGRSAPTKCRRSSPARRT